MYRKVLLKDMKRIGVFCFIFLLWACGNTSKKEKKEESPFQKVSVLQTYSNGKTSVHSFDFDNLEKLITLKNDTTYVVNFWATWCAPCVEELPYFEKAHKKFSKEKVKIILVNLDFPKHIEERLLPFMEEHNILSEVLILNDPDANRWINSVDPKWDGSIPATIIHKQNQREFYNQQFEEDELNALITKFVNN